MTTNFVEIPEPDSLSVCWMVPLQVDNQQSRNRYTIGKLWRHESTSEMVFSYTENHDILEKAINHGFEGYPTFPLITDHVYPNAMDVFGRRLPSEARKDYSKILKSYALDPTSDYSRFQLLAATGGRLTTDSYEFVDPLNNIKVGSIRLFDVAGVRRFYEKSKNPTLNETLSFERDPKNKFDEYAVKILNALGEQVGWVNNVQSKAISTFLANGTLDARVFRVNGRQNYPRIFAIAAFTS